MRHSHSRFQMKELDTFSAFPASSNTQFTKEGRGNLGKSKHYLEIHSMWGIVVG